MNIQRFYLKWFRRYPDIDAHSPDARACLINYPTIHPPLFSPIGVWGYLFGIFWLCLAEIAWGGVLTYLLWSANLYVTVHSLLTLYTVRRSKQYLAWHIAWGIYFQVYRDKLTTDPEFTLAFGIWMQYKPPILDTAHQK